MTMSIEYSLYSCFLSGRPKTMISRMRSSAVASPSDSAC